MSVKFTTPTLMELAKRNFMTEMEVREVIEKVKNGMKPKAKRISVIEGKELRWYSVERRGAGILNTKYGKFWEFEFTIDDNWEIYSVIIKSDLDKKTLLPRLKNKDNLVLRIDSGCKTGQVFGDLTCECREQLALVMKTIAQKGEGIIINIPKQDGRGMGISFKLATLWLQDELDVNTVEAAYILAPNGVIDIRTYSGVICILKFLKIPKSCVINLASNNPLKAPILGENGFKIGKFTPIVIKPNKYTERHLKAKQEQLGHLNLIC